MYLWSPGLSWEEDESDNVRTYQYLHLINADFAGFLESLRIDEEE